ncbi:zinc ribbon domain-containing protein [Candidatus Bathyarchaeota archaeon]|nr:zinc ribbon domain-containing protein [Candidatus Bathyarchaeota archaeon]
MSKLDISDAFVAGLGLTIGLSMGQYMAQLMTSTKKPIKQVIICLKCGNPNPNENKFCGTCGQALYPSPPIQCPKCSTTMPSNIKFCRRCGFPLKKIERTRKKRN